MLSRLVRPEDRLLTEEDYRRLTGPAIRRMTVDLQLARLALMVGADEKTLRQAREERASLSGAKLFNLLAVDPTALDGLLQHFGLRAVPIDPAEGCDAEMLAEVAALTSEAATAMADGRIDHIERGRIVKRARPVVQRLTAEIARHDREQAA